MKTLIIILIAVKSFSAFAFEQKTSITVTSAIGDGEETILHAENGRMHSLLCHQGSLGSIQKLIINAEPGTSKTLQAIHTMLELKNMEECEVLKRILLGINKDEKVTIVGLNGEIKEVMVHK